MKESKFTMLPILSNPLIKCYRIHAYLLNIMQNTPNFFEYMISNYLCLHNKNMGTDYLDFHLENYFDTLSSLFNDNSWFDICQIDISEYDAKNSNYLKQVISENIGKGYYMIHAVNESYLPHTEYYGNKPLNNLEMTVGYANDCSLFNVLDYGRNGRFKVSSVPTHDYINSIITSTTEKRYLNFIKALKGGSFYFDKTKGDKLLRCHIESQSAYPDYVAFANNLVGYNAINRSLSNMKKYGYDLIRLRVIMEHKGIIMHYFGHLCNIGICNPKIYEEYTKIYSDMASIFMCVLKDIYQKNELKNILWRIKAIEELNKIESCLIFDYLEK